MNWNLLLFRIFIDTQSLFFKEVNIFQEDWPKPDHYISLLFESLTACSNFPDFTFFYDIYESCAGFFSGGKEFLRSWIKFLTDFVT